MDLVFEWDPRKNQANLEKHRISFSEATSVFGDPLARIFADEDHSTDEQREILIGHSRAKRAFGGLFHRAGGELDPDH